MGSETCYSLMKTLSLINRSTKRTQRLANRHFFPFKTNRRKCDLECPIHGIISSCEIEGTYLGRVLSIFWPKKLHNGFSEKIKTKNKKKNNNNNKKKKTKKKKTKKKKTNKKNNNILVNLKDELSPVLLSLFFRCFTFICFLKIDDRSELWTSIVLSKS